MINHRTIQIQSDILEKCKQVGQIIDGIERRIGKLEEQERVIMTDVSDGAIAKANRKLTKLRSDMLTAKNELETIVELKKNASTAKMLSFHNLNTINYQNYFLTQSMKQMSDNINKLEYKIMTSIKNNLKYQMQVANVQVTDDEFDDLMQKGNFHEIFVSAATKQHELNQLDERTVQLNEMLEKVEETNKLMILINSMVEEQGEIILQVEKKTEKIKHDVEKADKEVEAARWYQKNRNQMYMGIGIAVFVVVLVIIIAIVV